MNTHIHDHPLLGPIECLPSQPHLVQFLNLPYASIPQRFARSKLRTGRLTPADHAPPYDATKPGSSSIQPLGSAKMDAEGNQLPTENLGEESQSELGCLNLQITMPMNALNQGKDVKAKLPVLVFLHGGAFFLGAGTRGYYDGCNAVRTALDINHPVILVAPNYRLGALGFFHCPSAGDLVPANNGLQDQLRALEWVRTNIAGFGGDPENVTLMGQSAGGESTYLHSHSGGLGRGLYRKAIMFSGGAVTMPAMNKDEHEENFMTKAKELGIHTSEGKTGEEIAKEMIQLPVEKIRDLAWVGAPCAQSEEMPEDRPSMAIMRKGGRNSAEWLESQIVSSCSYDGSISHNMLLSDDSRKKHAAAIKAIAHDVLSRENAEELLHIYDIKEEGVDADDVALKKVCQFESDIGFFAAALSAAIGSAALQSQETKTKTYFQLFTMGNPFSGPLTSGKYASHTWDIVALLGAHDERVKKIEEDARDTEYTPYTTLLQWRQRLLKYVATGEAPWTGWESSSFGADGLIGGSKNESQKGVAMVVANGGMDEQEEGVYLGEDGARRRKLLELAQKCDGEKGWDVLWEQVCRRFLMAGK